MIKKQITVIALAMAVFIVSACGTARKAALPAAGLPIVQKQIAKVEKTFNNDIVQADALSLEDAIYRAMESNPELQVFKTEIKAREARTVQESLLPNPEFDIEIENFAGSGALSGFKSTEMTLAFGQLIELGGKRGERTKVAALESDLALWRYEKKRLNIITDVRRVFTQVLAAQNKLNLDRQLQELAQTFKTNIDTLVQAGRLSTAESARAQVELSNRTLAIQQSKRVLSNAKRMLAASWGSKTVNFFMVDGELSAIEILPEVESLNQALEKSPIIIEQNAVLKRQKAETELAKAQAVPDLVISAGYRRYNESDDQAFVAGLSIPLPIYDRNQGGRQEAQYRERQSEQRLQSLRIHLNTEVNNQLETMRNISAEIEMLQNIILPEAQSAYDIIQKNYRLGKYGLIDVLDAQRQLFDAEGRYLDALAEINLQIIELEGLLGQSINSL